MKKTKVILCSAQVNFFDISCFTIQSDEIVASGRKQNPYRIFFLRVKIGNIDLLSDKLLFFTAFTIVRFEFPEGLSES